MAFVNCFVAATEKRGTTDPELPSSVAGDATGFAETPQRIWEDAAVREKREDAPGRCGVGVEVGVSGFGGMEIVRQRGVGLFV